jgi:hypothetical protein
MIIKADGEMVEISEGFQIALYSNAKTDQVDRLVRFLPDVSA